MLTEPSAKWLSLTAVALLLALAIALLGSQGLVLAQEDFPPHAVAPDQPPVAPAPLLPPPFPVAEGGASPAQPVMLLNVNYRHDWVEGQFALGHTIWLTVTDSVGNLKATAALQTVNLPHWPGNTPGFSSQLGAAWQPVPPDIQPGDWVYGSSDNGASAQVQLGTITGNLDVAANTLAGTVTANWFTNPLNAYCVVWVTGGPTVNFQVNPNGGSYACDLGAAGWDVIPGQNVAVGYVEPGGNQVINVFIDPVPDLRMEKWAPGSGLSMPGGPVVYALRYRNDGAKIASTIVLTDVLPAGTTYLADSSGVPHTSGMGTVHWNLPALDPQESNFFYLVLNHTASVGTVLHNQADVWVGLDPIPGNNTATANVSVAAGQPDLFVGTNPSPADPAAGQTMLWSIDYRNDGPVASGQAILTDTLPAGTSVVSWESDGFYNLWQEVSNTPGQLVLSVPSIPGNFRDRISLRLTVGAGTAVGTQLTNVVQIATAQESDPTDNDDTYNWVRVGVPRADVSVVKTLTWGTYVPGGQVAYNIVVRNVGNQPADVSLTDFLPPDATLSGSWHIVLPSRQPLPPTSTSAGTATWNLGSLPPGESFEMEVRATINLGATPGTMLNNCAEVTATGGDSRPANNRSCFGERVWQTGSNLQVTKACWWNATSLIECQVSFRNLGNTTLQNVTITDPLPAGTTFSGDWRHSFWEPISISYNAATNTLSWQIAELQPTWASQINFVLNVDPTLVGDPGLAFVNAVSAQVAGDVNPIDNEHGTAAYSGPDLYVTKRLSSGVVQPGGLVTFIVEYGNMNVWPWSMVQAASVVLTETLPAGATFMSSTAPSAPTVNGQTLVWNLASLAELETRQFEVVVRLPDPLPASQVLVNRVQVGSSSPFDVEYNRDNNVFNLSLLAPAFHTHLPLVMKAYLP